MESIVKKMTKKNGKKVESYQKIPVSENNEDIEEGKQETLLDDIERYRAQDKFSTLIDDNEGDDEEDEKEDSRSMVSIELDPDQNISLNSNAWPKHESIELQSKVHKIIRKQIKFIDKSKIKFRQLKGPDIEEVRKLHNEWFPI